MLRNLTNLLLSLLICISLSTSAQGEMVIFEDIPLNLNFREWTSNSTFIFQDPNSPAELWFEIDVVTGQISAFEDYPVQLSPQLTEQERQIFDTIDIVRPSPDMELLLYSTQGPSRAGVTEGETQTFVFTVANRQSQVVQQTSLEAPSGVNFGWLANVMWADDGSAVAINTLTTSGTREIYYINIPNRNDLQNITQQIFEVELAGERYYTDDPFINSLYDISDDGSAVLLSAQKYEDAIPSYEQQTIFIIWHPQNPEETQVLDIPILRPALSTAVFAPGRTDELLVWMPESLGADEGSLYSYNIDTGRLRELASLTSVYEGKLSPHGEWLSYSNDVGLVFLNTEDLYPGELIILPPVAHAGEDQVVHATSSESSALVTLDGSESTDHDGIIALYSWTEVIQGVPTELATGESPSPIDLEVGTHNITLTVTDTDGATDSDDVIVIVNMSPNADAGDDQVVTDTDGNGHELVTLDGSGSDDSDGTLTSYVWSEVIQGVPTELATGETPDPVDLAVGTHIITLTVTDNHGAMDSDEVVIVVNAPPTANAGSPQTVHDTNGNGTEQVTLDGSGSTDNDGTIATYSWKEGSAEIATGATPQVTLATGTHTITLTVTDNYGATDTDTVVVIVNVPPVANAGSDQTVTDANNNGSELVTLNGTGSSDSDGTIASYSWKENTTEIATGVNPQVSLAVGTHTITLTVTDDDVATDTDEVIVVVNDPPVADAGDDQVVTDADRDGHEVVTLDGSESADSDGTLTYVWTELIEGVLTELATSELPAPVELATGTHSITLTVTDNHGATDSDEVVIVVNTPPTADAGDNQTVHDMDNNGSELVILHGQDSSDTDGAIVSYAWTEDDNGDIVDLGTDATLPIDLAVGTHIITLTVTDDHGAADSATITVKVNKPPVANAGTDQVVTDSNNDGSQTVTLNGSGSSDTGGSIVSYSWKENGVQFATTVSPQKSLSLGVHTITLTVTDNDDAVTTDEVVITVNPPTVGTDWLTFSSNRSSRYNIYVANTTTEAMVQLTFTGSSAYDYKEPKWSPDRQKLLLTREGGTSSDICLLTIAPYQLNCALGINSTNFDETSATWSDNGLYMVYVAETANGDTDIFKVDISASGAVGTPLNLTHLASGNGNDFAPDWYADQWIAFISDRDGNREVYIVYASAPDRGPILDPDDGNFLKKVTTTSAPVWHAAPSWERDGGRIMYTYSAGGANSQWDIFRRTVDVSCTAYRPGGGCGIYTWTLGAQTNLTIDYGVRFDHAAWRKTGPNEIALERNVGESNQQVRTADLGPFVPQPTDSWNATSGVDAQPDW